MDIKKTEENLKKRRFEVSIFKSRDEAADYITGAISGKTVGIGGSMTIKELGLYEKLKGHNDVIWHWVDTEPGANARATAADVYLTSANAVAETGEIINIDGGGNRVSATLFAKEKVYIIIGINKIAPDFNAAMWRARNIAAPQNAKRLNRNTPCAVNGDRCYDCSCDDRICNGLVVLWGNMLGVGSTEVVIIEEGLGM